MTRQDAIHAQDACALATTVCQEADQRIAQMQRLSEAIEVIKGQSDETAEVVQTIDESAFQTNLLAQSESPYVPMLSTVIDAGGAYGQSYFRDSPTA